MKVWLSNQLSVCPSFVAGIRRVRDRGYTLKPTQTKMALKNVLRYILDEFHEMLAPAPEVSMRLQPMSLLIQNIVQTSLDHRSTYE